jgi:hypothetical protein
MKGKKQIKELNKEKRQKSISGIGPENGQRTEKTGHEKAHAKKAKNPHFPTRRKKQKK